MSTHIRSSMYFLYLLQVTGSMAGVVKSMESAMKSMNLEKVRILIFWAEEGRVINPCHAEYFIYFTLSQVYRVNLQYSSCKHVFSIRVENSMDPDKMASDEVS